ncbi:MAG: DUF362 domain-containing protein [Candidatus Omnitrophica bacterium]|nr:DUF362 domain-containing protein [Candidatus Omnitrophota bacterium]
MPEKSAVFFIATHRNDPPDDVKRKLSRLLQAGNILGMIEPGHACVIKMHFGEKGNTGYVKPAYIRTVTDAVIQKGGIPVLSDTNTLYRGMRSNSDDHLAIAQEHGFTEEATGAPVKILDDSKENIRDIPLNGRYIKTAKIIKSFLEADVLIDISHFKGHLMTGFGGALKNIGMGCASREGKLAQHIDIAPVIIERKCIACGACAAACPSDAIAIVTKAAIIKKASIDGSRCIGCASCIAACPQKAIDIPWEAGGDVIQEKMAEYAKAVLDSKKGRAAFINFAVKITKECDCLAKDDSRIVPDIGILASTDPVSIDKACLDLTVRQAGRDIFKHAHPRRNGMKQLIHAEEIGLGSLSYDLITL